jgi:hypothetical protein
VSKRIVSICCAYALSNLHAGVQGGHADWKVGCCVCLAYAEHVLRVSVVPTRSVHCSSDRGSYV